MNNILNLNTNFVMRINKELFIKLNHVSSIRNLMHRREKIIIILLIFINFDQIIKVSKYWYEFNK